MNLSQRIAEGITAFAGDMKFVYFHAVVFAIWLLSGGIGQDPYPYGLLTMIVSLESIFLSAFVMISQNRQAEIAEERAEQDLTVNTKAELEVEDIQKDLEEIKQLIRGNK